MLRILLKDTDHIFRTQFLSAHSLVQEVLHLTLSLPKTNLIKPRKLLNPELSKKPKGVSTQMKALDEHFLMVVFTLLLNTVHVLAIFMFNLDRETW